MSSERGEISLVGLLVAMIIFAFVLGATLTTYESGLRATNDATQRTEAADRARDAEDRIAKALRNLASPRADDGDAITTAAPLDLVFKTVGPSLPTTAGNLNVTNTKRVRYCLNTSNPARARLYEQTQTWTTATAPAPPGAAACGAGAGWTRSEVIADRVTNARGGTVRPVFTYNNGATAAYSTAVHTELFVDPTPGDSVPETSLSSGVFLRNQNRAPTARFTPTVTASGIVLNGSASVDPEGATLDYTWIVNGATVGTGITFTWKPPAPAASRAIQLTVSDGKLTDTAPTQTVTA